MVYNISYTWRFNVDNYNVLGITVDDLTYSDVIKYIENASEQIIISSVNPEIILKCQEDGVLKNIINSSHLKIADGVGTVWAVKKLHGREIKRITGIDLLENILDSSLKNKKVFLYGSVAGVAEQAMETLNEKYECNIVGFIDGYEERNEVVIDKINQSEAEIVFVGLGCPKQEQWIEINKEKLLNVKVLMGVGGSFDVLSGNIKRAPIIIQKLKLEWLYRLIKQPKRLVRQFSLIKYMYKVHKN